MEDLTSLVQAFVSSIPEGAELCLLKDDGVTGASGSTPQFEHFQILRRASCSVYNAFTTAFQEHTHHDARLCLQPSLGASLYQAQLNVALQESGLSRQHFLVNVETTIKALEKGHQTAPALSADATFKRARQTAQVPVTARSRKRVRLQPRDINVDPARSAFSSEAVTSVPDLYLQRNFCTLVKRASCRGSNRKDSQSCIGLLRESDSCRHLAYFKGQSDAESGTSTSLAELISFPGTRPVQSTMSVYQRIQLARILASGVLYYHVTPWIKKRLRSTDVCFLGAPESLLNKAPSVRSYVVTSVQALGSFPGSQQLSEGCQIVRNPVIFGLGIMLLELAYQATMRDLEEPTDIEKGQSSLEFVEYFTAHRLLGPSHRMVSRSFKMIITKCLHCDFEHDSDFTSPALQQAFYEDVVCGLVRLEKTFQDLQLDDDRNGRE